METFISNLTESVKKVVETIPKEQRGIALIAVVAIGAVTYVASQVMELAKDAKDATVDRHENV
jgi:hypothetical protein